MIPSSTKVKQLQSIHAHIKTTCSHDSTMFFFGNVRRDATAPKMIETQHTLTLQRQSYLTPSLQFMHYDNPAASAVEMYGRDDCLCSV